MTQIVASSTESRAAQRLKALSDTATLLRKLSPERITCDLPPELANRLKHPRFRTRLERRFLLHTGAQASLPDLIASPAAALISLDESGLRDLIVDVGTMCQFAPLRRIIDQTVLADLSTRLGLPLAAHHARQATHGESLERAREIAAPHPVGEDEDALVEAILRDGLQCWTCWVHGQPSVLRDFFRALTPPIPQSGGEVATEGCRPRDCHRRAALFAARLDLALAERDEPVRREA